MFKVGQKVYCKPGINISRYNKGIMEGIVKIIGRKYLTVEIDERDYKFDKNSLDQITNYCADYYLYADKQTILNEQESEQLASKIREVFSRYGKTQIPLEKLRLINEILFD